MNTWQVAQGDDVTFQVTIADTSGNPVTTYAGSELLAGVVWAGANQTTLLTLAPVWASAAAGLVNVPIAGSATRTLAVGQYTVRITLTDSGGAIRDLFRGLLEILPSAGTATAPTVYCQYTDMLNYCPYLEKLQTADRDQAGYAAQRHLARTWLEGIIQRHYRQGGGVGLATFGNAVPTWGPRRTGADSLWLQQQLDANLLLVKPRVVEVTAKYAAALVLQAQRAGAEQMAFYRKLAAQMFAEADALVLSYTAEIDLNGDGYADTTIEIGTVDALYG